MERTLRVRVRNGVLEPLEHLDLAEGQEVVVTIIEGVVDADQAAFRAAAGKWKSTHDPDSLIAAIYADRERQDRPQPRL